MSHVVTLLLAGAMLIAGLNALMYADTGDLLRFVSHLSVAAVCGALIVVFDDPAPVR